MITSQGSLCPMRLEGRHRHLDALSVAAGPMSVAALAWAEDQQWGPAGRWPRREPVQKPAVPVLVDVINITIVRARLG